MSGAGIEVREREGGASFPVKVKAGGRRDALGAPHGGAVRVEVRAVPERGRANEAVLDLLAGALDLPRANLRLLAGATSSCKQVGAAGLGAEEIRRRLARVLADLPRK